MRAEFSLICEINSRLVNFFLDTYTKNAVFLCGSLSGLLPETEHVLNASIG